MDAVKQIGMFEGLVKQPVPTKQDLCTPQWLLDAVDAFGRIALDPCGNPWSNVPALRRLSRHAGDDGLTALWPSGVDGLVYCNPPYNRMPLWVDKCIAEASSGSEIILLCNLDPSVGWFARLWESADAMVALDARVKFRLPGYKTGARAPSLLTYFGPHTRGFADHFGSHGYVIKGAPKCSP